jgi:hypothetical protein
VRSAAGFGTPAVGLPNALGDAGLDCPMATAEPRHRASSAREKEITRRRVVVTNVKAARALTLMVCKTALLWLWR